MIEDQLVHMDRVCAIEATMDEMKSQHEATHQLLQDVLARLGPVRGTPYASDSRPSSTSASATSSLFRNAFGRMTSYATRSQPASTPDRLMSRDVA